MTLQERRDFGVDRFLLIAKLAFDGEIMEEPAQDGLRIAVENNWITQDQVGNLERSWLESPSVSEGELPQVFYGYNLRITDETLLTIGAANVFNDSEVFPTVYLMTMFAVNPENREGVRVHSFIHYRRIPLDARGLMVVQTSLQPVMSEFLIQPIDADDNPISHLHVRWNNLDNHMARSIVWSEGEKQSVYDLANRRHVSRVRSKLNQSMRFPGLDVEQLLHFGPKTAKNWMTTVIESHGRLETIGITGGTKTIFDLMAHVQASASA